MIDLIEMTNTQKLHKAQQLLSEVYSSFTTDSPVNRLMSCADDCIWEALEQIKGEQK